MRRGRTEPSSHPTFAGGPHPIACTAPYDWEGIRTFLAARAVPGLERVTASAYARTISLGGRHGTIRVREAGAAGLVADLRFPDPGAIPAILGRIGRLFDVAADCAAIGAQLSGDPDLARLVSARPGLRVPGAWDGFELGVRAILGQQVSVTAATRLAATLVAAYGPPLAGEAEPGLSHVFPAPEDLAEADIARVLNMPRARGAAIRSLAAATAADPTLFAPGQGLAAAVARLTALPGIGPWTAQYIAMRALREPDALPPGDIGLLRALETGQRRPSHAELLTRAEGWRPWRAYAAMHLWAADAESTPAGCGSKGRDAGAPRTGESAASRGALGAPSEEMAMPITDLQTETRAEEDAARWAALASRDRRADGQFVYAVRTTGIYCRPSCAARAARPENVRFHPTCEAAEAAGFRPCKRCRPNEAAPEARQAAAIARACRSIEEAETLPLLEDLARAAGMSPFHFHRVFKRITGVTPRAYAGARRAERVAAGLQEAGTVTEAIYAAGYNSASRFYAGARLGMTPTAYRRGGAGARIRFALGACSLGAILVAATERGVCAILLGDDPDALLQDLQDRFPAAELVGGEADFEALVARVVGFVEAPGGALGLPLDIGGTAFQQRVWEALRRIPAGTTASYAEIARAIGAPTATRAVARACGQNALAVAIPCHRVVRQDGALSGYRWGVARKRDLLAREGVARRESVDR